MKKESVLRQLRYADVWILLFASLLLCVLFARELFGFFHFAALTRTILLILNCAIFYLGGLLYCKRTKQIGLMRVLFGLFFVLYLYLLLSLTLLDPSLGRGIGSVYDQIGGTRELYTKHFVNLIPLRSIYSVYIKGFLSGQVTPYYTLLNLCGNVCAFMPLSFFLPYFLRAQRKPYCFLPTVLLFAVAVELLQLTLMVGSCDVDDLLLNVGGAAFLYQLLNLPVLQRLIGFLTMEAERKDKQ